MKIASFLFTSVFSLAALLPALGTAQEFTPFNGLPVTASGAIAGAGGVIPALSGLEVTTRSPFVHMGTGHIGAGTGGKTHGLGNAVGGINNLAISVSTGGINDIINYGSATGGMRGGQRVIGAGSGGILDVVYKGAFLGGVHGSVTGVGSGGINDMVSLGATTGGINDNNAPRIRVIYAPR